MKHIWFGRIMIGKRKRDVGKFYFFHNVLKGKEDKYPFKFLYWFGKEHYICWIKARIEK